MLLILNLLIEFFVHFEIISSVNFCRPQAIPSNLSPNKLSLDE